MRGKGKRPARLSTSPYARSRTAQPQSETRGRGPRSDAETQGSSHQPLSDDQLNEVAELVSSKVAPQLIEAVQQAVDRPVPNTEGNACPDPQSLQDGFNPMLHQINSVHDDLGANVTSALRLKIINNEFVDLGQLLSKPTPISEEKHFSIINGELVAKEKRKIVRINDIDQWTDAFIIFMSIYTSEHPEDISGLLKYMHSVRTGAKRVTGLSWKAYDEQFRLRKAQIYTKPWNQIDQELWLIYMYDSATVNKVQKQAQVNLKKCYDFNNGYCNRSPCFFKHLCLTCNGNHKKINCMKSAQSQSAFNSSFRSGSTQPQGSKQSQTKGNFQSVNPRAHTN
ncbi:uncharacterized protein LOC110449062 [Mizuhopecten yessoensis]|uniref:C3H1-type domain-containing protein n=1 Tax=Mizuhopecten yessoensis TaxID=6573 RepID=A0A210QS08_MIZYE|nr:uncharacterized protein LOC110448201 isoform X2 [Mizuhopecten yessoensis]XP_021350005.1 uncharacterized protein LOC110448201 isoform X2 [Mizuhopecten yessoensis]XP_021351321.1 uncharacterized protein LOC110449062 [Mizuhopecten yessoensis]XP_021351322.1 uncharacterized protein LOC110449062 [Mizuhopecten yessoensis]OWF51513.1 hypothetical protein KP79_PYT25608 [Mizuhopecten yessoensis]OWF52114.1 hypothetical protein KP79_PYT25555 [Mizuhopecten yessoensis]